MLGLIGLIILQLNLQNNEKSPCKIDIYAATPTFSLAPQCTPTFLLLESPLVALASTLKLEVSTRLF